MNSSAIVSESRARPKRLNLNQSTDETRMSMSRNRSANHITQTRDRTIHRLFRLLNPDSQGYVSAKRINVDKVDKEILAMISPILIEMEDLSQRLDFSRFQTKFQKLMQNLAPEKRKLIYQPKKLDPAPIIAPKSRLRRSQSTGGIYSRLVNRKRITDEKTRLRKEALQRAELSQCTFKPKIKELKNSKSGNAFNNRITYLNKST